MGYVLSPFHTHFAMSQRSLPVLLTGMRSVSQATLAERVGASNGRQPLSFMVEI